MALVYSVERFGFKMVAVTKWLWYKMVAGTEWQMVAVINGRCDKMVYFPRPITHQPCNSSSRILGRRYV
jgi:predicted methyltransferase